MRLSRQRRQPEESKERKNMSGGGANGNIGSLSVTGTQIVRLNMKRGLPGG